MDEPRWSIVVHGGARSIAASQHAANRAGCLAAVRIGAGILTHGGSALDAVEQAVRHLEDDTTFNAGSGSVPTSDGSVETDAAMMNGSTLEIGAVAALSGVRNPVSVARLLLSEPTVLLAGAGAVAFAKSRGVEDYDPPASASAAGEHDTVGCVAMDCEGRIAVGTSTGGLPGQLPGRVGDAPIPGCGFYADDAIGGVAISGDGESILRVLLATRVIDALKADEASNVVSRALRQLSRVGGEAGIIAIDHAGRFGLDHTSEHFAVALAASWLPEGAVGVDRNELKGHLERG